MRRKSKQLTSLGEMMNPAERDARLERLFDRMTTRPPRYDCEACEDTGTIVSIDERGIARGRACACLARRISEKQSGSEADLIVFPGPVELEDEDEPDLFGGDAP